jgi:DNA-binding YbaB/EbfC family protein
MLNPMQKWIENALGQVQADMQTAMTELEGLKLEATSGGGVVKVVVNGLGEIFEIVIDPEVVNPEEVEMLQDLVCSAVREALSKAGEIRKEKLMGALPLGQLGMDIPWPL